MPEYTITAKIDPTGVAAGRTRISQELAGIEADAQRTGNTSSAALDRLTAASGRAGEAAAGVAAGNRAVGAEATAMAAAAQASAKGLVAQADAARLNSVAMRETLVVARELSRGNFTRLPGSLSYLAQGISTQGGLAAYATALGNTIGILKTTQDAELALAAADAQTAASAIKAAAARTAASIEVADTEIALAEAQLRVTAGTSAEGAAQVRLAEAHQAVAAAAAEAAVAENALTVAEERAGAAAVASAEATTVGLNPVAIVIGVVVAAAAALYFAFRQTEDAVAKATDKIKEDAEKSEIARQAHERWNQTLDGLIDRQGKLADAMAKRLQVEDAVQIADYNQAKSDSTRLQKALADDQAHNRDLQAQLSAALADPNRGTQAGGANEAKITQLQRDIAASNKEITRVQNALADASKRVVDGQIQISEATGKAMVDLSAQADRFSHLYTDALRKIEVENKTVRDQAPEVAAGWNLVEKALSAAASAGVHFDSTIARVQELGRELLHNQITVAQYRKEMAGLAADLTAAADAAKKGGEVLALPISGGRITTRFGQIESGVGVGPHAHQGLDIATPVGTPVYARSGGTVDFARQMSGYGNVIQINFGGGVTARYGHLEKFNVKPGDVVNAGDIIGLSGGARGAEGAGDSTGPHLHYEERVGNRAVNPLTARVNVDTEGAQTAGYKKAEEAAAAAAKRAESEKNFVDRTIDAANETALPKIDALAAKIKKTMDDYREQFKEAMKPADAAAVTKALTDAEAREIAQHFQKAYVDPLTPLREGLGKTAVQQAILNAVQKEETDLGRPLNDAQRKIIENYYEREAVLKDEDAVVRAVQQPLEDYRVRLLSINDALTHGRINQKQFNAQIADLNAPLRQFLANAPEGAGQRGGINVKDPNENLAKKATRNFQTFGDAAKAMDENARYSSELEAFDRYRKEHNDLDLKWNDLEEQLHQRHIDKLNEIDQARRDLQLSYGQQIADSLYQIAVAGLGKQSAVARAAFAIEKAFTIARASLALYQDVASALSKGFPQNLPLIAQAFAEGATIISAIRSIVVPGGYMAGGYTGDGGRSVPAGTVHGQEFVINADATSRNRMLLEAINNGSLSARSRMVSNDNAPGGRAPTVTVHNHAPGVEFEVERGPTTNDVVVIARRVARQEAPGAVAADMAHPYGKTAKVMGQHYGISKKRP